jgi:hypothetical protein
MGMSINDIFTLFAESSPVNVRSAIADRKHRTAVKEGAEWARRENEHVGAILVPQRR